MGLLMNCYVKIGSILIGYGIMLPCNANAGRAWKCQRGNQKDRQCNDQKKKDKQQSTNHYTKNKDRATRTPLKIWGELRSSGRISRCCSTCDTHRVTLVTHPEMYVVFPVHWVLHSPNTRHAYAIVTRACLVNGYPFRKLCVPRTKNLDPIFILVNSSFCTW